MDILYLGFTKIKVKAICCLNIKGAWIRNPDKKKNNHSMVWFDEKNLFLFLSVYEISQLLFQDFSYMNNLLD